MLAHQAKNIVWSYKKPNYKSMPSKCLGYKSAGRWKLSQSESDVMLTLNKENNSQCTRQSSRNGQRIEIAKGITSLKK